MKKIALIALMLGMVCTLSAGNLVGKKWQKKGNKANVKIDAVAQTYTLKNDGKDKNLGLYQFIKVNQTAPKAFTFSGESKSLAAKSVNYGDYSLYLDLTYVDGSRDYGKIIDFTNGAHDWEKKSKTYTPKKAVKSIDMYLLFRRMAGEVIFRNIQLQEVK